LAVKAAGQYGPNSTAQALRLDYYSLRKHIEAARRGPPRRTTPSRMPSNSRETLAAIAPAAPPADHLNPPPESKAGRRYASLPDGYSKLDAIGYRRFLGLVRAGGSRRGSSGLAARLECGGTDAALAYSRSQAKTLRV